MRSLADFQLVWTLIDRGLNDCAVSRETGIPRPTVREWRLQGRDVVERRRSKAADPDCPACGGALVPQEPYGYLLGLYLGDGCISTQPKGVNKLRVILDQRYPGIIHECSEAMRLVRPSRAMRVGFVQSIGCMEVGAFWKHWPCLFPQHGTGRKHERRIELKPWQLSIVNEYPDRLLAD